MEHGGHVFIRSDLVLFGGLVGPHDFADLVEAADHGDDAVDLGLADPPSVVTGTVSQRFQPAEKLPGDLPDACLHIPFGDPTQDPSFALCLCPQPPGRAAARFGDQLRRDVHALGECTLGTMPDIRRRSSHGSLLFGT